MATPRRHRPIVTNGTYGYAPDVPAYRQRFTAGTRSLAPTSPQLPGTTPPVVLRHVLFESLEAGIAGGVTLLSAPPGSGKTFLLRSWINASGLSERTAWVSVDRGERDSQRFWLALVNQLRVASGANGFVENLTPSPEFNGDTVVDRLVSELDSLEDPIILVIDDLHELSSAEAFVQIERFLARRPPLLWIVLATRRDLQLGLHRLRLSGQLTEIREPDLRFTLAETRELLTTSGITLSEESICRLHERTEGWAAGLRLAALSLADHPDPERFVVEFSGSERTVADYLLAEVLERQPGDVRQLLLCTSILEQVNGALADALLGTSGAERVLHSLVQANAFIVPLDAAHSWFRYHHLFVDLLRLELRRTAPEVIPGLHRAAATWYAEHGYVIDAIRHAQAAEDWPYASRLLADHNFSLVLDGHEATIHTLLAAFPADAVSDPELARVFAGDQLVHGSLDNVAAFIDLAERHAGAVPDERLRRFQIALAVTRLSLARRRGDFSAALNEAQALIGPSTADTMSDVTLSNDAKAFALKNLGIVELWSLRIDEAIHHLEQGLELGRQIGRPYIEVNCLAHLALAAGRHSFTQQLKHSLEAIEIAEAQGWAAKPVSCVPMAATGIAYLAQGRFAEGESWLDRAERAMSPEVDPATALLIHLARGLQYICQGQFTQALTAFHAAEQCQTRLVTRHVLLILTRQFTVYTQLRLGDLAAARATIADLSDEEEQPWGELGAATAALHLADGDARAALDVLAPVLAGVAPMVLELTVVQAFILEAIARDRIGERQARDAAIERALDLAEQDGTLFAFALVPAQALLERHRLERTTHPVLVADILDMLTGASPPLRSGDAFELHEDLSEGELRVLRFLPSNLSAPEIAAELSLSTSTVKTHMRHIYSKLDVHRRTEAVERSRALGLLRSSTPPKR